MSFRVEASADFEQQLAILRDTLRVQNIRDQDRIKSPRQIPTGKIQSDDSNSFREPRLRDGAACHRNSPRMLDKCRLQFGIPTAKRYRERSEAAADIEESLGIF